MNVVFIPVRGGSKSIPLKNIKEICGKPLVYWAAKASCESKFVDKVYIATDSNVIKEKVMEFTQNSSEQFWSKLQVISRNSENASDTASTESVMAEFSEKYEYDNIALVQATSPLITADELNRGFELISSHEADSVLSVVRQKRFNWCIDREGFAHPENYDINRRPRRQEFDGYLVENGAFYITSKKLFEKSLNRLSGRIKVVEMPQESYLEIDEPLDWVIIENLLKRRNEKPQNDGHKIKLFICDCDGCLTDGGMYYSESGDELKKFNTKDGMAFELLRKMDIKTGIITGEKTNLLRRRAEKIKADFFVDGCKNKIEALEKICSDTKIKMEEIAYVGDDINDLEAIKRVGISCCPKDAVTEVKKVVSYISEKKGGEGVIREFVDFLIEKERF